MKLPNIFRRQPKKASLPLFDEAFLRRLERLSYRTAPSLRGGMMGERRSRNLRPALDFSDHRPYSTGDDLRHIDWNAFGRHEELFVKLGEATQNVNIHILLDRSRSMAWEPGQKPVAEVATSLKWDGARRLAGTMSYLALAGGEQLEITPFSHGLDPEFGPTQGKRQIIRALQFLTDITPAPQPSGGSKNGPGLAASLTNYARKHPKGGLLVLISDLVDSSLPADPTSSDETDWGHELAEGLRYLPPPRWQVLVMHVLTEQEMKPTLEGDYDFQDVETGQRLPFHLTPKTLAQYRLRVRRWCAQLQSASGRRAATYARILTEWPLEQAVLPYLRQRGVIQ